MVVVSPWTRTSPRLFLLADGTHAPEHSGGDVRKALAALHDVEVVPGLISNSEHAVQHFTVLGSHADDARSSGPR